VLSQRPSRPPARSAAAGRTRCRRGQPGRPRTRRAPGRRSPGLLPDPTAGPTRRLCCIRRPAGRGAGGSTRPCPPVRGECRASACWCPEGPGSRRCRPGRPPPTRERPFRTGPVEGDGRNRCTRRRCDWSQDVILTAAGVPRSRGGRERPTPHTSETEHHRRRRDSRRSARALSLVWQCLQ
jgi:hypothetical protein